MSEQEWAHTRTGCCRGEEKGEKGVAVVEMRHTVHYRITFSLP